MIYRKVKTENSRTFYQVYEGEKRTAEFSWRMEEKAAGTRCWIEEIRLESQKDQAQNMERILQFLQYKCLVSGCREMYVRLHRKNLFAQDLYKRYGFSIIARAGGDGARADGFAEYVLKYTLPESRDADFQHYIRRKRQRKKD